MVSRWHFLHFSIPFWMTVYIICAKAIAHPMVVFYSEQVWASIVKRISKDYFMVESYLKCSQTRLWITFALGCYHWSRSHFLALLIINTQFFIAARKKMQRKWCESKRAEKKEWRRPRKTLEQVNSQNKNKIKYCWLFYLIFGKSISLVKNSFSGKHGTIQGHDSNRDGIHLENLRASQ